MATLQTIAKAEAAALAIGKAFGVQPSIEYTDKYARVYYTKSDLLQAQRNIRALSKGGTGDLKLDVMLAFAPAFVEKTWPYILGILVLGYFAGKATR